MLQRFVSLNRSCSEYLNRRFPSFFGSPSYQDELRRRVKKSLDDLHPRRIIEVGGIDRPLISKSRAYTYVGVDIEAQEQCYEIYDHFVVQSIEQPLGVSAEIVMSITLLEHVIDNKAAVTNIARALNPGGATHHYLPSKYHPYAIALRMVGPDAQKKLIRILRPGAAAVTGYPAFFDHCSAPAMRRLFVANGLVDINVKAYYRANDYFAFFVPAYVLVSLFENLCQAFKIELLASGFVISARKPSDH